MLGLFRSADLFTYFVRAVVLLTTLPLHEFAHAWAAYKLGDDTASIHGRLTINPFAHLDPVGSLMIILVGFGWAKPVPINPTRFRGDMRKGMAISALAGPAANIVVAFITLIILKLLVGASYMLTGSSTSFSVLIQIFSLMTWVNISLGVFNLLPFPPLDGWRIASAVLPNKTYWQIAAYERQFSFALLLLVAMGFVSPIISLIANPIYNLLDFSTGWVYLLFGLH